MADKKLIVGLGNPGREYEGTRHNAGFWVIERLAEVLGVEVKKRKFGGRFGEAEYSGEKLILLKPWEYMNRSGQSVATVMGFYKLELDDLLVISDDLALEPGRIRLRRKGSSGGQKGLGDVITKLGSDEFSRLRIGIGHSEFGDSIDYVLGRPGKKEKGLIDDAVERAKEAVFCWLDRGIDEAMNRFND